MEKPSTAQPGPTRTKHSQPNTPARVRRYNDAVRRVQFRYGVSQKEAQSPAYKEMRLGFYAQATAPITLPTKTKLHPQLVRIRAQRRAAYAMRDSYEKSLPDGFVYAISSHLHPGSIKIGRSRDPVSRLTSANTWCPWRNFDLLAYEFFENCAGAEKDIHEELSSHRIPGTEWFEVSPGYAVAHLKALATRHKGEEG